MAADGAALASLGRDPAEGLRKARVGREAHAAARGPTPTPAAAPQGGGTPGGLDNLGNLCYANSALQCLYMVTRLRAGLFAADGPQAQEGVLLEIRRAWRSGGVEFAAGQDLPAPRASAHHRRLRRRKLFAEMQAGGRASADLTAFSRSLNLNHAVQQARRRPLQGPGDGCCAAARGVPQL